jgi:hypothetical protein
MQSSSRVPEEPLATGHLQPLVPARGDDAELSAIALLCLVFARQVQHPYGRSLQIEGLLGSEWTAAGRGGLCLDKGGALP